MTRGVERSFKEVDQTGCCTVSVLVNGVGRPRSIPCFLPNGSRFHAESSMG